MRNEGHSAWRPPQRGVVTSPLLGYDDVTGWGGYPLAGRVSHRLEGQPVAAGRVAQAGPPSKDSPARATSTPEGRAGMAARFAATHRMASTYNVRVYDMDKRKLEQQTYSFSNLDRIWEKAMMEAGAGAAIPISVLSTTNQPD